MTKLHFGSRWIAALACVAALAAACGGESESHRLARAAKELGAAREELARGREDLAAKQSAADAANAALSAARERVAQVEQRVAAAESSADLRVSDATLFRSVQARLLDDKELRDVAIQATVTQATVVLSGKVPREELRKRAVEIARATPGVSGVESQIEVTGGEGAK